MKHRFKNFQNFWRDFSANKVAVVALFIFSLILFVAIFAPLVSPTDPYDLNTVSIMNSRLPPLSEDFGGNYFLLGTDGAGRDMVSAIFYGLRVSLGVGVLSIVTTDVPGCRVVVQNNQNGFLVPAKNPILLADAIIMLIKDSALRNKFGNQNRAMVENMFSSEIINKQTISLYKSLFRKL